MKHYGLDVTTPYDVEKSQPLIVTILEGEEKIINREAQGLLVLRVENNATLTIRENITNPGLYHTYIYCVGWESKVKIESTVSTKSGETYDISHQVFVMSNENRAIIACRAAVGGSSTLIYTPRIDIEKGISGGSVLQEAMFLKAGPSARVRTIPSINSHSKYVPVKHSIAVTTYIESDIEYLLNKGYTVGKAKTQLRAAFISYGDHQ